MVVVGVVTRISLVTFLVVDLRRIMCPPQGKLHRYFFKVYALDTTLGLKSGATKSQLESAMPGHILAQGEMIGKYGR